MYDLTGITSCCGSKTFLNVIAHPKQTPSLVALLSVQSDDWKCVLISTLA